jgi:hypothetical protein
MTKNEQNKKLSVLLLIRRFWAENLDKKHQIRPTAYKTFQPSITSGAKTETGEFFRLPSHNPPCQWPNDPRTTHKSILPAPNGSKE